MSRKEIIGYINHNCIYGIRTLKETIEIIQQRIDPEKRAIKNLYKIRSRHISNKEAYDYHTYQLELCEQFIKDKQVEIDNLIC